MFINLLQAPTSYNTEILSELMVPLKLSETIQSSWITFYSFDKCFIIIKDRNQEKIKAETS